MANTRTIQYETLVELADEVDVDNPVDHPAYEFSQKTFYEDANAGVYNDNSN